MQAIIKNDGIGFSPDLRVDNEKMKPQSGLINIQKRTNLINGNCKITSEIQKGTTIYLSIPY